MTEEKEERITSLHNDTTSSTQTNNQLALYVCKWERCQDKDFNSLNKLVDHVSNSHLARVSLGKPGMQVRYSCQWIGCSRFGMEQPSRFALISHCRTHTGEKPYFCPIPECEKHFTRSDALAKHVKGVHDLHLIKDALPNLKDRLKCKKYIASPLDLVDKDILELIEEEYEFKNPWWFSRDFIDALQKEDPTFKSANELKFDFKQFKVASYKYSSHLLTDSEDEIEEGKTSKDWQVILDSLTQKLNSAKKINHMLTGELREAIKEKRKVWLINQALMDANVIIGLPEKETNHPNKRVHFDKHDDELLHESSINN